LNSNDKSNWLQLSNCNPIKLQLLNFTSRKTAAEILLLVKSQPINSQFINTDSDSFTLGKVHFSNLQFSYSPVIKEFLAKLMFENSLSIKYSNSVICSLIELISIYLKQVPSTHYNISDTHPVLRNL